MHDDPAFRLPRRRSARTPLLTRGRGAAARAPRRAGRPRRQAADGRGEPAARRPRRQALPARRPRALARRPHPGGDARARARRREVRPPQGYRFTTYATIWIRQAIGARDHRQGPRDPAARARSGSACARSSARSASSPPSWAATPRPPRLAAELGWAEAEVDDLRSADRRVLSLDEPVDARARPSSATCSRTRRRARRAGRVGAGWRGRPRALSQLHPRERAVIEPRYGLGGPSRPRARRPRGGWGCSAATTCAGSRSSRCAGCARGRRPPPPPERRPAHLARIERGRTYRHALRELLAHERYDRIVVAADDIGSTDVAWLLEHADGEILVLRPARLPSMA